MNSRKVALATLAALLHFGCVSPEPVVEGISFPSTQTGYIAGVFDGQAEGFGFGIQNTTTGKDNLFPFFSWHHGATTQEKQFRMIEVPPGTYQITYWATYNAYHGQVTRKDFSGPDSPPRFSVQPGRIAFIGTYEAIDRRTVFRGILNESFNIEPQKTDRGEVAVLLKEAYPKFSMDLIDF